MSAAVSATRRQQTISAWNFLWHRPAQPPVYYSTQLSAIMALELRAAIQARP